jgi:hypothetical protein
VSETRDLTYEIIVIDSASFDGSEEMTHKEYPQVRFIQSRENLGFAKSNNLAFEASNGEFLLFLNPDTEIVGSAINVILSATRSLPDAGAVGCKLLNSDGTLQTSCVQAFPTIFNQILSAEAIRRLTPRAKMWGMKALFEKGGKPIKVEMISGACLMMRRRVFERIGRFSDNYFMYAEDADLCYKARKHGFTNYFTNRATVIHHGGKSSQQKRSNFSHIMVVESTRLFLKKWRGNFYSRCYRLIMSGVALTRVALLVMLSPVLLARSGVSKWKASCSKWLAVFNWGLGLCAGRDRSVEN